MNNKLYITIRILIWIIPVFIFLILANQYFSLDGHFHLKYNFEKQNGFISRFYSPDNYEIVQGEDYYIKIFNTPTAFNLKTPVKFEKAKVKIKFRSKDLGFFHFGTIINRAKTEFELQKIEYENKNEWITSEIEIDLENSFYDPKDKYGFVFIFKDGELEITEIEFDLYRDNICKTLSKKLR